MLADMLDRHNEELDNKLENDEDIDLILGETDNKMVDIEENEDDLN